MHTTSVVVPGGDKGAMPPPPSQIGQEKMAAKCGGLYFMFLGPPPSLKFLDPLLHFITVNS